MLLSEVHAQVEAWTKAFGRAPAIAGHLDPLFDATIATKFGWDGSQTGALVGKQSLDVLETFADVVDMQQSAMQGVQQTSMSDLSGLLNEIERVLVEEYPDLPVEFRQYLLILIDRLRAAINFQAAFGDVDVRTAADTLIGALHTLGLWDEANTTRRERVINIAKKIGSKAGYGAIGVLSSEGARLTLSAATRMLELTQGR